MTSPKLTLLVEVSQGGIDYTVDSDDVALDIIQVQHHTVPLHSPDTFQFRGGSATRAQPRAEVDAARVAEALAGLATGPETAAAPTGAGGTGGARAGTATAWPDPAPASVDAESMD